MRGVKQGRRQGAPRVLQPSTLSNLQSVLLHTAPTLPIFSGSFEDLQGPAAGPSAYFTLQDLWLSYEAWSAYGCEVPLRINVDGVWREVIQCYTPHLSGLQLFSADRVRRIPASSSSAAVSSCGSEDEAEGGCGGCGCGCGPADDACSTVSACTSSTASTASTASDSDGEDACKDSPTAEGAAAHAAARAAARAARGSVLARRSPAEPAGPPLFEFMEAERPHLRLPLHDKVAELAEAFPGLMTTDTRDLHPASWFAVTWVPIYRIPGVPDPAASRDLQANFLTYHSLCVPPQRPHAQPADPWLQLAPQPPMLDPIGAAAVAWRQEVARQGLVATAVAAMAAAQQQLREAAAAHGAAGTAADSQPGSPAFGRSGEAASPAAAAAARVSLDGSAAAAAATAALSALPLSAACLRPFAFVPYKACGPTWVDDWNLQRQHLPMIAAAGSWVARRAAQLPDFEFMSSVYRPLPTSYTTHRGR